MTKCFWLAITAYHIFFAIAAFYLLKFDYRTFDWHGKRLENLEELKAKIEYLETIENPIVLSKISWESYREAMETTRGWLLSPIDCQSPRRWRWNTI